MTGWPTENAELLPALGLDDSLTGHITDDTMLFVALARLTADPATRSDPLTKTASVRRPTPNEIEVHWQDGPAWRVTLSRDTVEVTPLVD